MPLTTSQHRLNENLVKVAKLGDASAIELLTVQGANPLVNDSMALRDAAFHGHADCVLLLIPVSDPKALDSRALILAARHGHADCVRLLLPVSGPTASLEAFKSAMNWNHPDCVAILLSARGAWPASLHLDQFALDAEAKGHLDACAALRAFLDAKALAECCPRHAPSLGATTRHSL